jgi:hypothetical protein
VLDGGERERGREEDRGHGGRGREREENGHPYQRNPLLQGVRVKVMRTE